VADAASVTRPVRAPGVSRTGTVRRWLGSWPGFVLLLVVLSAALVVGSGLGSAPPSAAQRAAALDGQLRCPQCEDLSVAQSNASSAIAVRRQVAAMVAAGDSVHQIEQSLVARYGERILLVPSADGLGFLIWLVPAVVAGAAAVGLGVLFVRRSATLRRYRDGPP
jgi:cytochrome c-type biogenesis protein CcmH